MAEVKPLDLGPQYAQDDPFTRRMRLHQSWWRASQLDVACGVGPHATSPKRYGNMLTDEDGARGKNFLTPEIAEYAIQRQREFARGIKRHRLLCNLLSSQPMCFNLFAPLAIDAAMARPLAAAMFEGLDLGRVVRVVVEHEPEPRAEHLDDATSFDAFLEVENADGAVGFVAIETKLTEPFSQTRYPIAAGSVYRRWIDHDRGLWQVAAAAALEALEVNQLFRDHALAFAALLRPGSAYTFGAMAVVRHPGDPVCETSLATYRRLLRPGADAEVPLIDLPLDHVVRRLRPVVAGTGWASWLDAFDRRYVDLERSAGLVSQVR